MVSKVADDEMLISETFSKDAFWHAHKYTTNIFGENQHYINQIYISYFRRYLQFLVTNDKIL